MPELPDVEGFRRFFDRYGTGKLVEQVKAEPDAVRNTTPQGLGRSLSGRHLQKPDRYGKWLVCPAGRASLVLHFGMTGHLVWSGDEPDHNKHDRLTLTLEDGELRYRSQRKFGGAWLLRSGQDLQEVTGPLGPDALSLSPERFAQLLRHGRGGTKSALMNQELVSGLGNVIVDEILWTARVDPRRKRQELSGDDLKRIERSRREVLRASVDQGWIPDAPDWLTGQRGKDDPQCPRCGGGLEMPQVAGRTTYVCPRCQQ